MGSSASAGNDSSTTASIPSNPPVKEEADRSEPVMDSKLETPYPSNSYYCGMSMDAAANACSIPCPSSQNDECPGDLSCFGGTECMNRESYYCGSSWLDASDTCSKPCAT